MAPSPRMSPMHLKFDLSLMDLRPSRDDLADCVRAFAQLFVLDDVEHGMRGGAGDGVAGIGAAEATGSGGIHHIGAPDDGSKRHAASQAFR